MKKILFYIFILSIPVLAQSLNDANKLRLAQSYESIGNFEKALELYRELYQSNRNDFTYYDGYLKNLMNLKFYNEAIGLVGEQIKRSPGDYHSYGILAVLYYRAEKLDSMDIVLRRAYALDKTNPVLYRTLYSILIDNRLFDKAIEVIENGKKNCAEKNQFIVDLINLYSITMNYQQAAENMVEILMTEANHYYYVENRLSTFVHKPDGLDVALRVFREASDKKNNLAIDKIYAWLLFAKKDFNEAFKLIQKIDAKSKSEGAEIINFAQRAFNEKEYNVAIESYNYILKNFSNKKDYVGLAQLGLARSYENRYYQTEESQKDNWKSLKQSLTKTNLDLENAINYYNQVIEQKMNLTIIPEAIFRIAKIRKELYNNFSSAKKSFEDIMFNYAWSDYYVKSLFELGRIASYEGKYDVSNDMFYRVKWDNRATEEDKALSNYLTARNLIITNNLDSARTLLGEAVKNIYLEISNDILELQFIIQENETTPENVKNYLLACINIEAKNYEAAEALLKPLTKLSDDNSLTEISLLLLSDIYVLRNDYSSAISNLQYIINIPKEKSLLSDKATYKLANVYEYGLLNKEKALETYESLLINYPNSLFQNMTRKRIEDIKNQIKIN